MGNKAVQQPPLPQQPHLLISHGVSRSCWYCCWVACQQMTGVGQTPVFGQAVALMTVGSTYGRSAGWC
jgi:hypothetical protein